ncbi:MAG: hypothetical protein O3A29_14805 [Planctomycetota bacterium]|nr:hypothetical protein [Planctomycetota bacterium]
MEYLGDEDDLLVYYLSTGLDFPQAVDDMDTPPIILYENSLELRRYYMAEWAEMENLPPRPRRFLTEWWEEVLIRIRTLGAPHRWEMSCALLDLSFEAQKEFEQHFNLLIGRVAQLGNDRVDNAFLRTDGRMKSGSAVVAFAFRRLEVEERNDRIDDLISKALDEPGVARVVVIGRDVESRRRPYDVLAYGGNDIKPPNHAHS